MLKIHDLFPRSNLTCKNTSQGAFLRFCRAFENRSCTFLDLKNPSLNPSHQPVQRAELGKVSQISNLDTTLRGPGASQTSPSHFFTVLNPWSLFATFPIWMRQCKKGLSTGCASTKWQNPPSKQHDVNHEVRLELVNLNHPKCGEGQS